ncbi:hypothetical protein PQQ63_15290 [Paraburkholderia metrosideri]|uniref:Uncharacterized protein n=1 Tax=Paraburkholderia metrosideri TaxID=580937 RepID=A0ABW9DRU2_9BURK
MTDATKKTSGIASIESMQKITNDLMRWHLDQMAHSVFDGWTSPWPRPSRWARFCTRVRRHAFEVKWRVSVAFDVLRRGDRSTHLGDY